MSNDVAKFLTYRWIWLKCTFQFCELRFSALRSMSIEGWAQVMYPYASSFDQTAQKLEYDMYYLPANAFLSRML